MSWLIKSNLPEASSKISITVPTVRRVPDVFLSHRFAHEHMSTHTQIYTPRPTVAIQKPKGGENSVSGFQTPRGKSPSLPLIRSLSSVSSRKILQALSFQLIRAPIPDGEVAPCTHLITFVTVIIQESDIKSLPVKELLLETVSVQ